MKTTRFLLAALALTCLGSNAWADTDKLTAADGWTKITSVPTASEIASNYYVFVDATRDLMLGIGKGTENTTKWYSLALYYRTSVSPTSKDITPMVWTLESYDGGFSMRNLDQPVRLFQTENNAAWYFDTNDVTSPNSWSKVNLAYSDGKWTLENGKYTGNYIGPWIDNNFTNGAECAGNKTTALRGYFHIYAISRTQFKQNLLDNASESNPVDLTPWYVTNATLDNGVGSEWTSSFAANSSNWWGSHAFSNTGAENYQQVADFHQDITIPNGKYKVAMQGAMNKPTENEPYVYGIHNGTKTKTYFTQSTQTTPNGDKWNDMQYTLLQMMSDRSFGQVTTAEITVTTGSLTIGYANEGGWSWDVFDNFKLYCTGLDLSAYQGQLADLVSDCNTFVNSHIVPTACENAISSAITTYNQTYETAKEYSTAIVALTNVLETYSNDTELQTAYANYYTFKTKIETLKEAQESSSALTTFNNAISNATTIVETTTTAVAIETQTNNLRSAGLTYISSVEGQFDITFLASQLYRDWKKKDGSAAGIVQDQFLTNRPSIIPSFAENFEWTATTTGNVLYQSVNNLPAGYYQVGMYTMALSTSQRDNITTEASEGDADRSFAFAGDLNDSESIQRTGMPIKFATAVDFSDLTILDVNVHLSSAGTLTFGVQKDANGSNWHFAQIASIVYSRSPDLTGLKATRDALVSEANGLLASEDADLLTEAQKAALQNAIDAGNAADDFDELNTATLTTLPNAINTARQQIQTVKDNRVLMLAALERFENDYNLTDGTDYRRVTMSADAWATLLTKVNAVTTALDDVSQAANYGTLKNALIAQMDATDTSLRLFKSYKAMANGTVDVLNGVASELAPDSDTDTDASETAAITRLNTAFVNYALAQDASSINVFAFLGENLDFSAAKGSALNTDNSNAIYAIAGWEVNYADADTWAVLQNQHNEHQDQLYIRKNWGSAATTLTVAKEKMLPEGKYTLSFSWDSDMANMTNLSQYVLGGTATTIGEETNRAKTLTYEFEVIGEPKTFDLTFGFQKQNEGNTPAQLIVDDVVLTYMQPTIELADDDDNAQTITANENKTRDVKLLGRTFIKDGNWNTLCLPFDVTMGSGQMEGATAMTLNDSQSGFNASTGLLTLYFDGVEEGSTIAAGTPFIVKWTGTHVSDPVFRGVTISDADLQTITSSDSKVSFLGTYKQMSFTADDTSILFLGDENTLYYPTAGASIGAQRAYFHLGSGVSLAQMRDIILNFGDEEVTGISSVEELNPSVDEGWYTLQGVRLDNKPMLRGIYLRKGRKVVVK